MDLGEAREDTTMATESSSWASSLKKRVLFRGPAYLNYFVFFRCPYKDRRWGERCKR